MKVVGILDCGIYSTLPFRFEYKLELLILSRFWSNRWIAKNKKQKTRVEMILKWDDLRGRKVRVSAWKQCSLCCKVRGVRRCLEKRRILGRVKKCSK